jgi:hypothetical protein
MNTIASTRRVALNCAAVTPSDSTDLPTRATGGLWVVATGNVVMIVGGTTVTLTGVAANTHIPLGASRVKSTGTSATLLALY